LKSGHDFRNFAAVPVSAVVIAGKERRSICNFQEVRVSSKKPLRRNLWVDYVDFERMESDVQKNDGKSVIYREVTDH